MSGYEEFCAHFRKARDDIGVKSADENGGKEWTWNENRQTALSLWARMACAVLVTELDKSGEGLITEALYSIDLAKTVTEGECRATTEEYQMSAWTTAQLVDQIKMVSLFCGGISDDWIGECEYLGVLGIAQSDIDNHMGWKVLQRPTSKWPSIPRAKTTQA